MFKWCAYLINKVVLRASLKFFPMIRNFIKFEKYNLNFSCYLNYNTFLLIYYPIYIYKGGIIYGYKLNIVYLP